MLACARARPGSDQSERVFAGDVLRHQRVTMAVRIGQQRDPGLSVNKTIAITQFSLRRGFSYLFSPIHRPILSIEMFLCDPRRTTYAALGLWLLGILYTVTVAVGYQRGFGAVVPPLLAIPAEEYYFWQSFFCMPLFFVVAILFAGSARLLASLFRGRGSFEDDFALVGIALVFPIFLTMWLPESALILLFPGARAGSLGGFALLPFWADALRQLAGIVWPLVFVAFGLRRAESLSGLQAALVTVLAFLPAAALMAVFVR